MVFGDRELLVLRVARDLDELHPVEERCRDRREGVCGRDEEHVGEVVRNLEVVVRERAVLLGVEDLEEGARRVSRIGDGKFVDLVEDEDRVLRPCSLHALHDPSGQRPDVGPPVPSDLRLVFDAAEADPDVLPPEGVCDALPEACLAGAGRACEEEDRTLLLLFEFHDRQVLDDPLLDLRKAVMVALEDVAGLLDIDALLLLHRPGKVEQEVEVVSDPLALVVLAAAGLEFFELCKCLLPHLVRHRRALDPLPVSLLAGSVVASIELLLDHLQLLPQHRLAVRLTDLVGYLSGNIDPDGDALFQRRQDLEECTVSLPDGGDLEEPLLPGKVYRHERHDESHDPVDGIHRVDGPGKLFGTLEVAAYLVNNCSDIRQNLGPGSLVEIEQIRNGFTGGREEPVFFRERYGRHPVYCLCKDQVSVVCRLDTRDLEEISGSIQRAGRYLRGLCAAVYGQPDRTCGSGISHFGEEPLPGDFVDLELCPAFRIDHRLEERYDHYFSG